MTEPLPSLPHPGETPAVGRKAHFGARGAELRPCRLKGSWAA